MSRSGELPDCFYPNEPVLIRPNRPTPKHSLYLSNLDDQKFLRFSIKYIYVYKTSVSPDSLKSSLSSVLVGYYPLAGRLRRTSITNVNVGEDGDDEDGKLEVDCNGQGAVFVEAFAGFTAEEFLGSSSGKPNRSWRKLLYRVEARFLDIPPLIVQVTYLRCGGMILCAAINHCLCDGVGSSQFLHAWAHLTANPISTIPVEPFHSRHVLNPSRPPNLTPLYPGFTRTTPAVDSSVDLRSYLQSQPLATSSLTFTAAHILRLKSQCVPSLKCTTFEALAAHTWRSWAQSLDLPPSTATVKLLFSVNVRARLAPPLPEGFYGNGFVLGCAESGAGELANANLRRGVRLVQQAKEALTDGRVKRMVGALEDRRVKMDVSRSLVISQWTRLGLEELDFGEGRPEHVGPVASDVSGVFLPVIGDKEAVRVVISMPKDVVDKFECHMMRNVADRK